MAGSNLDNKPDLIAYELDEHGEVVSWERIGVAWRNSKGGAKIILDGPTDATKILLLPPRGAAQD